MPKKRKYAVGKTIDIHLRSLERAADDKNKMG